MKIAFILPSLANAGPVIVAQDLCMGLTQAGHHCKMFYFNDIVQLKMPCPVERIRFREAIDFSEWDVVHSHTLQSDLYVWYHLKRERHSPICVSTLHNPIDFNKLRMSFGIAKSFFCALLWKMALSRFDMVVALNEELKQSYQRILPDNKLTVVFNGRTICPGGSIDETDRIRILALRQKYTVVGTTSGINRRKGLEQMVQALVLLPNYAFVAVGDGPELDALKSMALELGVSDRCYWTGYRPDGAAYQSLFDIFVMCTRSEGFPLALIEAAGSGKPTVLSDIPILRSAIPEDKVVFYELDNIHSLANAVERVAKDRIKFAEQIYAYYCQSLTLDAMTNAYLKVYESLIQLSRS